MAQALIMPFCSKPSPEETEEEGRELFENFVCDEIKMNGLNPQTLFATPQDLESDGYEDMIDGKSKKLHSDNARKPPQVKMIKVGKALKELAAEFAKSKQREEVRNRAEMINVATITKEDFLDLLTELFNDSKHPLEKIVTLFFFCSDLLINVLKKTPLLRYGFQIFQWCIQFISNNVSEWVQSQGGWSRMFAYVPHVLYWTMAVAVTAAAVVYIRKNW